MYFETILAVIVTLILTSVVALIAHKRSLKNQRAKHWKEMDQQSAMWVATGFRDGWEQALSEPGQVREAYRKIFQQ